MALRLFIIQIQFKYYEVKTDRNIRSASPSSYILNSAA